MRKHQVCMAAAVLLALAGAVLVAGGPATAGMPEAGDWGRPALIDPLGEPQAVSCASPRFCMVLDYEGNAVRYQRGQWDQPVNVIAEPDYMQHFASVSCPSSAFCAAVSRFGDVVTYQDGSWSEPIQVSDNLLPSVSCASRRFCIAVGSPIVGGGPHAWRYDGSSWMPEPIPGDRQLLSVSCPSRTFCVATGYGSTVYTYDGTSWSGPQQAGDGDAASCSSPQFCLKVSQGGHYSVFDGTNWSPGRIEGKVGRVSGVSCPVDGTCTTVTSHNHAFRYADGVWAKSRTLDPRGGGSFHDVSCPTSTFCAAVEDSGYAVAYHGRSPRSGFHD